MNEKERKTRSDIKLLRLDYDFDLISIKRTGTKNSPWLTAEVRVAYPPDFKMGYIKARGWTELYKELEKWLKEQENNAKKWIRNLYERYREGVEEE